MGEFFANNKRAIVLALAIGLGLFLVYWFFLRKKKNVLNPVKEEKPLLERTAEMKLAEQVEAIKNDTKWMTDTEQTAEQENNPIEKQVVLNAIWVLKQDEKLTREETEYLEEKYTNE